MTILFILLMLAFNALFAAYEMALASVSRTKISVLLQEKHPGSEAALFMKDHMEGSLATVQIGITLVGAIAAATGGIGGDNLFVPFFKQMFGLPSHLAYLLSVTCVVVPLSFVTIVFGELIPKTFALKNKEWVLLKLSSVMKFLYSFLAPIVGSMENIVHFFTLKTPSKEQDPKMLKRAALEDLRTAAAIASSSRLFTSVEEKIVISTAQFCVRKIREIQVPLEQVYMLDANASIADTFLKAHLDMHTRFPVLEHSDNPQSVIGYLNFKDIFTATKSGGSAGTSTRSIMRPILRLEADTIISAALQKLMKTKQHICLVTEEEKITGIVTLEDIFEEMVGEIEDEYDFFPSYIKPFGNAFIVSASANMSEIFEKLNLSIPADLPPTQTVEQWIAAQLGGEAPTKNQKILRNGIILETRKFRRHKLMEAIITKAE